jgi:kynurenine formamidase
MSAISNLVFMLNRMAAIDLSHELVEDMPIYPAHSR